MALSVVGMDAATGKNIVIIKSDLIQDFALAIEELKAAPARTMAVTHAAQNGVMNARVEMPVAPYPIDPEGKEVTNPIEQTIDHYRVDIPISQGMR